MMTCTFDAVLDQQEKERNFRCVVRFAEKDYAAEMSRFPQKREEGEQPAFYFVRSSQPIPLVWKHPFIYTKEKESAAAGKATVLFPGANRVTGKKEMARRGMLFLLSEGVEEMVRAVVDEAYSSVPFIYMIKATMWAFWTSLQRSTPGALLRRYSRNWVRSFL